MSVLRRQSTMLLMLFLTLHLYVVNVVGYINMMPVAVSKPNYHHAHQSSSTSFSLSTRVTSSSPTATVRRGNNAALPWRPQAPRFSPLALSLNEKEDGGDVIPAKVKASPVEPSVTLCDVTQQQQRQRWGRWSKKTAVIASVVAGLYFWYINPKNALAAATAAVESTEHLHVGQKIANFFRSGGLPDAVVLMLISAMPVVELRGGVPVGLWMGLPLPKVFALCVLGNMLPIPIILLALRSKLVQKLAKPVLKRAREKAKEFGDASSQSLALTLFVGIPLPGTGAWTGAMGAFLLGMSFQEAMLSILLGVVAAGAIMSCLTLAGKAGALVATGTLAAFCVTSIVGKSKEGEKSVSRNSSKDIAVTPELESSEKVEETVKEDGSGKEEA